jgi:hypothetical protein
LGRTQAGIRTRDIGWVPTLATTLTYLPKKSSLHSSLGKYPPNTVFQMLHKQENMLEAQSAANGPSWRSPWCSTMVVLVFRSHETGTILAFEASISPVIQKSRKSDFLSLLQLDTSDQPCLGDTDNRNISEILWIGAMGEDANSRFSGNLTCSCRASKHWMNSLLNARCFDEIVALERNALPSA